MSTSYYRFRTPISSVRIEEGGGHDILTIFESGANSGTLVVSKGKGRTIASFFADEVDDNLAPIRTHFGGKGVGCIVTCNNPELDKDECLIDEYGNVFRVSEIQAMSGKGK